MRKNDLVDTPENKLKVLSVLQNHVGEMNAISMTALYEAVFSRPWNNQVNDTRPLRKLVTLMRDDGVAICSVLSKEIGRGGGYYIANSSFEQEKYLQRLKSKALKELRRYAKIKKITLPNFLGQLKMETETNS
jgi:hypothetical protein